jgi:hypothetical protein
MRLTKLTMQEVLESAESEKTTIDEIVNHSNGGRTEIGNDIYDAYDLGLVSFSGPFNQETVVLTAWGTEVLELYRNQK